MKTKFASIGAALLLVASLVRAEDAPSLVSASPAGAELYFIAPLDGDTVPATFTVRFGLRGMGVRIGPNPWCRGRSRSHVIMTPCTSSTWSVEVTDVVPNRWRWNWRQN